jgi:hypothetical protein
MAQIGSFAARAEQAGFESVGVIDRLVYDNLDPPARNDTLTSAEDVRRAGPAGRRGLHRRGALPLLR